MRGKQENYLNNFLGYEEDVNGLENLDDNYGSVGCTDESENTGNEVSMPYSIASRYLEGAP